MRRDIAALIAFIDSRQNVPHEIGPNDCVSFIIGAVEAETGVKPFKRKWASLKAALKLLAKYGSLEAAMDAHFRRIAPAQAMRGDIGGVPDDDFGIHPAIVEGITLVGPGDKGNKRMPRKAMTMAWSVDV